MNKKEFLSRLTAKIVNSSVSISEKERETIYDRLQNFILNTNFINNNIYITVSSIFGYRKEINCQIVHDFFTELGINYQLLNKEDVWHNHYDVIVINRGELEKLVKKLINLV